MEGIGWNWRTESTKGINRGAAVNRGNEDSFMLHSTAVSIEGMGMPSSQACACLMRAKNTMATARPTIWKRSHNIGIGNPHQIKNSISIIRLFICGFFKPPPQMSDIFILYIWLPQKIKFWHVAYHILLFFDRGHLEIKVRVSSQQTEYNPLMQEPRFKK